MRNSLAFIVLCLAGGVFADALPRVWMSTQWGGDMEARAADMAAHGVDVIEIPLWTSNLCAQALSLCRRHGLKAMTGIPDPCEDTRAINRLNRPYERAVMIGGAYRGRAIDRHLFSFTPAVHDIVVEPPVYSARQPYVRTAKDADGKTRTYRAGHYFGGLEPLRAEVVVPLKLFDGRQHLRIIPCELLPVAPDMKPENDTATQEMAVSPEVVNRRLVRLRFDLTSCTNALLDKVGVAVYWASDVAGKGWKDGHGQLSVFSKETRGATKAEISFRVHRLVESNGGTFPSDVFVAFRLGDECFNLTGFIDCPAASYPLWDYSPSALAAFTALVPDGSTYPRTWGCPEIYGADVCGAFLYSYHKACADLMRLARDTAHELAPGVRVFRNTTRAAVWDYQNDHDGSGQELLADALDFVHLDPYPVSSRYNERTIPFDMGYMSGLARRYRKPLLPWLQAHAYAPCGLRHVTADQVSRMVEQHRAFAPDGIVWLGHGRTAEYTFPNGDTNSWARAAEVHRALHAEPPPTRPVARLAVLRPYTVRASLCDVASWSLRNPADAILAEFVRLWSVENGLPYDVFEIPPFETPAARAAREAELQKYAHIVSSAPYPGAYVVGAGTEGQTISRSKIADYRDMFREQIRKMQGTQGVPRAQGIAR